MKEQVVSQFQFDPLRLEEIALLPLSEKQSVQSHGKANKNNGSSHERKPHLEEF